MEKMKKLFRNINLKTFIPSCLTLIVLIGVLMFFPVKSAEIIQYLYDFCTEKFGWLYLLACLACFGFLIWISTSKVGNILLVSSKLNKKMNDYNFDEKKKILKQSQLITVQNFLHYYEKYNEWTNNLIIQRTEAIAKEAYNSIWKLDTNDI